MINLTQTMLKDIAEELEMGMRAFIHKETQQLLFVPDENKFDSMDFEPWINDFELLEENCLDYFEIENWKSFEAFEMMTEFAEQLTNNAALQNQLLEALNKRKPFREFKFVIDNEDEYREEWFAFKNNWQQEYVRKKLIELDEE
jgi:hypothetical protein